MNPHTPKWTLILRIRIPKWIPKFLERNCKDWNSMDWSVLYIIEKLLELRCLKCSYMTHLNISNTSYGQKKGRESNGQFDSQPLKVGNRPDFLMCRWCATYCWKALYEGYNFASNYIAIKALHVKLWAPKVTRVPTVGILRVPGQKYHLDVGLMERHKAYYKGEGGGFPQVRAMVSLVSPSLPVVRPNTKSVQTMH
jgi:hypothetical protein